MRCQSTSQWASWPTGSFAFPRELTMNENNEKDPKRSEAARRAWQTKKDRGIKPFAGHQSEGGRAAARLPPPAMCPCCGLGAGVFGTRMSWLAHRSGITQTERMGRAAMAHRLQRIAPAKSWRRLSNAYRAQHGLPLISGDGKHRDGIGDRGGREV